ncbi:LysR family transcriptional regulator [Kineobactrum salinum]|uniref:LysR family transcriptional regulator n=1 Tax=Kineobactrum salinum TaxID=2708301 RepID=A0A6C0TZ31_9GAMM|nr:LysR family transcriptional regulator [Kineobactrum salinum]QIB65051.1 LysR family transcriptional regulator [Kineobactrum salinum]
MELRQLRYFRVIADAGSFARGAEALFVAQPALSRSIAKLEEEIGHSLFLRHSTGVSLTNAGVRLYDHATQVLESVQHLIEGMAKDGVPHGTVTLGAPQSILSKLIAPVAAEFLAAFPSCGLNLIVDSSARLRDKVVDGSIDIAILPDTGESGMHFTPLLLESICLICRTEERPSFDDIVDFDKLVELPLVITGYPDSLRLYIDRVYPHQSEALKVRSEVNSSSLLVDLVMRGAGYGIAPCCVAALREKSELSCVPIRDLQVSWAVATNWNRRGLRAVEELEGLMLRQVREFIENDDWPTAKMSC